MDFIAYGLTRLEPVYFVYIFVALVQYVLIFVLCVEEIFRIGDFVLEFTIVITWHEEFSNKVRVFVQKVM